MAQQPAPPDPLRADKGNGTAPAWDRWITLLYNWLTAKIAALFGADFVIGTANPSFPNARVLTDSTTVFWTLSAGQVEARAQSLLSEGDGFIDIGGDLDVTVDGAYNVTVVGDVTYQAGQMVFQSTGSDQIFASAADCRFDASGDHIFRDDSANTRFRIFTTTGQASLGPDGWFRIPEHSSAPATPSSDNVLLYAKADGNLYQKDDAGTETVLAGSGGGDTTPMTPQGRLTLVTAAPVMTSEQAAKTSIYYTPYVGDLVPIYSGAWVNTTFTELTLALDSNSGHTGYHQSGKNFDLFVYDDGGTLRLVSGPAWSSDTARATALEYVNGILMNAASMTARFGAASGDTVTVAQDRGTYVGTFRASADGTTTWELGGEAANGDPINLFIWNTHNRVMVSARSGDTSSPWTYSTTGAWRNVNSSSSNRANFVRGLDEDSISCEHKAVASLVDGDDLRVGAALDTNGNGGITNDRLAISGTGGSIIAPMSSRFVGLTGIGFHFVAATEYVISGTGTWYGSAGVSATRQGLIYEGMH